MATIDMSDWIRRKLLEIMSQSADYPPPDLVAGDWYRRHLDNLPKEQRDALFLQTRPEDLPKNDEPK